MNSLCLQRFKVGKHHILIFYSMRNNFVMMYLLIWSSLYG